jgi:muramidase (phage lysozyme)
VWISLSRLRGFFDRRLGRTLPKDAFGRSLSPPLNSGDIGMQLPRHIKVRICHNTRHQWVRRFSWDSLYSTRRPLQMAIEIANELLNTVWSLRRDLIVGSVTTLGAMLMLFNLIDQPPQPLPLPPQAQWQPPAPLVMTGGDPYIRALMRTISASESNVEYPYSVVYGGQYVRDLRHHPDICVTIPVGPNTGNCSTAAGRYQMLSTTWQEKSERYHPQASGFKIWKGYNFEPKFQDEVVYGWLMDAKAWGNVDLADLLRQDRLADVLQILSPTWTSLGYGIETNSMSQHLPDIYRKMLTEELAGSVDSSLATPGKMTQEN